jgi:hypothetical protein
MTETGQPGVCADRCVRRSARVERLIAALVVLEVAVLMFVRGSADAAVLGAGVVMVWFAWLALLIANARLVLCGEQAVRFSAAPRWINRADFAVRMTLHLLINWSALATTWLVARRAYPSPLATWLLWGVVIGSMLVWLAFNVLHRRMNRMRNLLLSTALALALIGASAVLLFG